MPIKIVLKTDVNKSQICPIWCQYDKIQAKCGTPAPPSAHHLTWIRLIGYIAEDSHWCSVSHRLDDMVALALTLTLVVTLCHRY